MSRSGILAIALAFSVLILAAGAYFLHPATSARNVIQEMTGMGTTTPAIRYEVATTEAAQELGLGNRASIPDNYAMLFVFPKADRYGFWMKDMLVPIDIIWLSDAGDIILVDRSVDPATYPHAFYPPRPVRYVLEMRAGYAKDHGWTVGTHVALPSPYGS